MEAWFIVGNPETIALSPFIISGIYTKSIDIKEVIITFVFTGESFRYALFITFPNVRKYWVYARAVTVDVISVTLVVTWNIL